MTTRALVDRARRSRRWTDIYRAWRALAWDQRRGLIGRSHLYRWAAGDGLPGYDYVTARNEYRQFLNDFYRGLRYQNNAMRGNLAYTLYNRERGTSRLRFRPLPGQESLEYMHVENAHIRRVHGDY